MRAYFPKSASAPWSRPALGRLSALGSERLLLLGLVLVAALAHGFNMFYYPAVSRLDDEGIYMAQAWAVLREGRLAPYTYWYDHAPAGWILIAAWMGITGGPLTFGTAADSGRILMLVLHAAMVPLLYRLTRRLGGSVPAAALATLIWSLSPLANSYQRFVLLDTIMLFWIMLSAELLLDGWGRLSRFALSGICFGLALLSKETAAFMVPVMLLLAWQQRRDHHGRFALLGWMVPMGIVLSWYPLYAVLKGELLPAGEAFGFFVFGSDHPHVSLSESLRWQATRTGGGPLNLDNQFWQLVRGTWLKLDPLLFAGGAAATLVTLLRAIRDRRLLTAGLFGLLPLAYLARGGVVFDFYVLVALPFLAMNLALLADVLLQRVPSRAAVALTAAAAAALPLGYAAAGTLQPLYVSQPGLPEREAVAWIKQHLPPDSRIVVRDGFWTDLREPGLGGPAFPDAHSHWKVAADPEIRGGVFHDDWRNVDYLLITPELVSDFRTTDNQVALGALEHAQLVRRWEHEGVRIDLLKVGRPGGTERALLAEGASAIERRSERAGAYLDASGQVTSEAQSYAMLRAVWLADRPAFDRAWAWTRTNLVDAGGLPAWLWRDGQVADPHTASDASVDTALALLMAGRRWDDPSLVAAGTAMAQAVWQREVVTVNGRPYLAAGDWATGSEVAALNPSYFAPYAFRIFAEADPGHDWLGLVDTSYEVLFAASEARLGAPESSGLPPDWVGLNQASGELAPLSLEGRDTTQYGYDAARTYWRVALDARWSGDGRATAYLQQAGFLRDEVARKGRLSAVYARDGRIAEETPSVVGEVGGVAALLTLDPTAANQLHAAMIGDLRRDGHGVAWGDPGDLYAQEWGWFGTALYAGALPDIWHA